MLKEVELDVIYNNPFQKRQTYNDIEDLAHTIAIDGLQQIPKARFHADGVQLKFGHRRTAAFRWLKENWRAAKLPFRYNGYTVMPLEIEDLSDEQMYRGATIENSQRSELSPIERMEEMKGWVAFGYNSKQIADLYPGMSDATVRGLLYFDQLTPQGKEALHKGEITQGTARALLSMQKVATEKDIVETLKRIKRDDDENPEAIIESAIDELDTTVDMWNDNHRSGKPRAGYHGWLLDMKNFPNKMLPEMTTEDAIRALGVPPNEKNKVHEIVIWLASRYGRIEDADKNQAYAANDIGLENVKRLEHLINPPACTACPFYTKMRRSHYCGVRACHERKTVAWQRYSVEQASKNTKIAIYTEADGAYRALGWNTDQVVEKRHKDLRLVPKSEIKGYSYQHFKGIDSDVVVVVATGDLLGKLGQEETRGGTRGGKKSEKEKAEMRAMKIYRIKHKELMWEYTAAAQTIFDGAPLPVLKKLNQWHSIMIDDRIPEEYDHPQTGDAAQQLAYQRRALVWRLIMSETSHFTRSALTELLNRFTKITGVKAPKTLVKRAEEWEAEIKAIASVSTATKKGKKK